MSLGKDSDPVIGFKKFVSEEELEEARKKRQEEWEKVRKPDDPEVVPEEPYDPRSLYEQLQEQKLKKEEEYAEKQRFSNQVKRLDDDEAQFLEFVSQKQEEITQKREAEDAEVLQEYRSAVLNKMTSPTSPVLNKPSSLTKTSSGAKAAKKSQLELLSGAVKRKSIEGETSTQDSKKSKTDNPSDTNGTEDKIKTASGEITQTVNNSRPMTAQVIGILPGLGVYNDSDSSSSSESDIELPPDIFQGGRPLLAHSQDD